MKQFELICLQPFCARFVALLADVFPQVEAVDPVDEEFTEAVKASAAEMKLEILPEQASPPQQAHLCYVLVINI